MRQRTLFVLFLLIALASPAVAAGADDDKEVRFATFNASLNRNFANQLITDLSTPGNPRRPPLPRSSSG